MQALNSKFGPNLITVEVVLGQRRFQSAECCPSAKFDDTPAKQCRVRTTSVLIQFGQNFGFRAQIYTIFYRLYAILICRVVKWPNTHSILRCTVSVLVLATANDEIPDICPSFIPKITRKKNRWNEIFKHNSLIQVLRS